MTARSGAGLHRRKLPVCRRRGFVAPGGTGKTTLILYEAICIALGLPLYGLEVKKPGPVLILTAEDSREMLLYRL